MLIKMLLKRFHRVSILCDNPFPATYRKIKLYVHTKMCIRIFIAILFKGRNDSNVHQLMNKLKIIYRGILFGHKKEWHTVQHR
jgi:C4-dicarboxylate transporter